MLYDVLLYASIIIFAVGLIYRISVWLRRSIGPYPGETDVSKRISAAIKGILSTVFSAKILTLIKVLVVDILLQARVLKEDPLRWLMHMLIYWGFMLLFLMHALDGIITEPLFTDYYSTLNPFMFLRDLFGFILIIGIGIAVFRRFILRVPRLKTDAPDHYAIIILAVVILSGIFLEGAKITSYTIYQDMVETYSDTDDKEELRALESLWVEEFDLVSPHVRAPFDEEILHQGRENHETNCASCHSRPRSAFMGSAVAKITKPIALELDRAKTPVLLWYIHFLSCFLGLAYLPFSKMLHIFASPISLLLNAVMDQKTSDPSNIVTRHAIELDACTHCCTCSLWCSVAVALNKIDNVNVLPSERMRFLKGYYSNKNLDEEALRKIREGIYLCTNCDRCTVVCPVGINLRDLWLDVREEFVQGGPSIPLVLTPFSFYRGLNQQYLDSGQYSDPLNRAREAIAGKHDSMNGADQVVALTPVNREFKDSIALSSQASTYSHCFSCENCSTACPVVLNYENPEEVLGLLPHQIMRSIGLGLRDLAFGSRMLWDCLTCYQCQEHCPQGVKVTDIFYELKNLVIEESNGAQSTV